MIVVTEAKEGLPDPVLDTDGDELLAAGFNNYFITPVFFGMGGGLVAAPVKGLCQFAVAQQNIDTQTGFPLIFLPAGFKDGDVVRESTDMNIGFFLSIGCWPSAIWNVDDYDESAKQYFAMLGGVVGNPGNETLSNWFKIEKVGSGDHFYKIVFCPSVCDFCTVACSDVGIYVENGSRRLALGEYIPFHSSVPEGQIRPQEVLKMVGVWLNSQMHAVVIINK